MISFLILLARLLGLLQRLLGTGQTHLLTAAQGMGWKPGTRDAAYALQRRQMGLNISREVRRARKLAKRERRALRKELRGR